MTETPETDMPGLKHELTSLAKAVEGTRREIAAMPPLNPNVRTLSRTADDLQTVVKATAAATDNVLKQTETLAEVGEGLRNGALSAPAAAEKLEAIVAALCEACNFQDLCGQRISTALSVLGHVEARVDAMVGIWGYDSLSEFIAAETQKTEEDESAYLNGPAAEGEGVSQDDIDALFD